MKIGYAPKGPSVQERTNSIWGLVSMCVPSTIHVSSEGSAWFRDLRAEANMMFECLGLFSNASRTASGRVFAERRVIVDTGRDMLEVRRVRSRRLDRRVDVTRMQNPPPSRHAYIVSLHCCPFGRTSSKCSWQGRVQDRAGSCKQSCWVLTFAIHIRDATN
jgi:hypothetical protein